MNEKVSVVTLTHNKLEYTKKCLTSLLLTDYCPWELVVVDNGSTDGTRRWLEEFKRTAKASGADVSVILNPGNIGCSTARNQGMARASGRKIVFVDNDVAMRCKGWLRRMGETLGSSKDVALVGPKLVYPYAPFAIQCAGAAVSRSGRVQFVGRGERRDDPRFSERRDAQCLISACFMGRKSVLEDAGGFDEAFNPVEYEDIDLCYRLRSRGFRVMYEPGVEMYHFESVTTGGTPKLPNTYLIIKHGMLFKRRWRHMFEKEDGPSDAETRWRKIRMRDFASIGELAVVE